MRLELESTIRDLLFLGKSSQDVGDKIAARILDHSTHRSERRAFLNFLIQGGQYQKAYDLISHWMKGADGVPWQEFLFLLKNSGYQPHKEFLDYFFKAMDEINPKDAVLVFHWWSQLDPRFLALEKKFLASLEQQSSERVKLLFEKLDYFRTHRMIQEEQKLLLDLARRFPDNEQVKKDLAAFKSRWAHHLVAEKARSLTEDSWLTAALKPKPDEWEFGNHLLIVMKKIVAEGRARAYDFAIGFYMMDFFHHASKILELAPPTLATDWFRLEVLLKGRRYLECLDGISTVESKYTDDPETSFAATYIRAQVLQGLGQTHTALELIRSIVNIRPNYRSASSLLADWEMA